jgi:hypothetical protein
MQALQLITRGVPKAEACEKFGLSEWQFDKWMSSENEAIQTLQFSIVEAERLRLAQLANAQAVILKNIIATVTGENYNDADIQLRVLKYIDSLRNQLEDKHGVNSQSDIAEEYVLAGPKTRAEQSQMAVQHELSKSVVNIKTRADGSVDLTIPNATDIIDIFPGLADEDDKLLPAGEE